MSIKAGRSSVDSIDLQNALRALGGACPVMVAEGVGRAIEVVSNAMVSLCPVRPDVPKSKEALRPGEMRGSITIKVVSYRSGITVGLAGPTGRGARVARLVEFGHIIVHPQAGYTVRGRKYKAKAAFNGEERVPPHPFIRPAVTNTLTQQSQAFYEGAYEIYTEKLNEL